MKKRAVSERVRVRLNLRRSNATGRHRSKAKELKLPGKGVRAMQKQEVRNSERD